MASFSTEVWLILGLLIVSSVLAVLATIAAAIRNEIQQHDLQKKVMDLHIDYRRQKAELEAHGMISLDAK